MKAKLKIFLLLVVIAAIVIIFFAIQSKENKLLKNVENKIIYFYSQTCPHCAKVEKFLKENKIKEKVELEKRDVHSNRENAKLLILIAKRKCNLTDDEIGVPFLWDGSKCLIGEVEIINFFKEKAQI
jgi:glutaredoxin